MVSPELGNADQAASGMLGHAVERGMRECGDRAAVSGDDRRPLGPVLAPHGP
jgi:hypothetical protein